MGPATALISSIPGVRAQRALRTGVRALSGAPATPPPSAPDNLAEHITMAPSRVKSTSFLTTEAELASAGSVAGAQAAVRAKLRPRPTTGLRSILIDELEPFNAAGSRVTLVGCERNNPGDAAEVFDLLEALRPAAVIADLCPLTTGPSRFLEYDKRIHEILHAQHKAFEYLGKPRFDFLLERARPGLDKTADSLAAIGYCRAHGARFYAGDLPRPALARMLGLEEDAEGEAVAAEQTRVGQVPPQARELVVDRFGRFLELRAARDSGMQIEGAHPVDLDAELGALEYELAAVVRRCTPPPLLARTFWKALFAYTLPSLAPPLPPTPPPPPAEAGSKHGEGPAVGGELRARDDVVLLCGRLQSVVLKRLWEPEIARTNPPLEPADLSGGEGAIMGFSEGAGDLRAHWHARSAMFDPSRGDAITWLAPGASERVAQPFFPVSSPAARPKPSIVVQ
eukprot:tig00000498_g1619.t1